ncbi:MAG TPA: glycoside hydrolase family 2 TIM barrel-domain containing protein [Candidatus Saccharimonadales bacterium]|nr:glycoside hydrolase family 2 TIM barrel-domain containing protein [Candidatus Saccharimonadales bacterium]
MQLIKRGPILLASAFLAMSLRLPAQTAPGPAKVELRKNGGAYQLYVNHKPFYVKGAGLGSGSLEKLAENGGNSFRTWGARNGLALLNQAHANGLYVTMGLDVGRERQGFDYNDPAAVARQLAAIKVQVLKYKDHPALIIWAIGNELNLHAKNPQVWDAVNGISKMIHAVDPNHLTLTPLAGFSADMIHQVQQRAPDLDLIGIQMYGSIVELPRLLRQSGYDGPYLVTEWGATGHWEVPKTEWGAPIENDSTTKANAYLKRYQAAIESDPAHCLGSYVFLWGQKQERTPTWYGMFLRSGEETATVDVLHTIWKGRPPANSSPKLEGVWLNNQTAMNSIHLKLGQPYPAKVAVTDPDGDSLTYHWVLMDETRAKTTGGDFEREPKIWTGLIHDADKSEIVLTAPGQPGPYRLFAYAFDGKGHAAHANIPFYVDKNTEPSAANSR